MSATIPTMNEDEAPKESESLLSRKLRKLVDSQLESDPEIQEALEELSTFFIDNNLKNRRGLRGEIERRSLDINADFIAGFGEVDQALEEVWKQAKAMNDACLEMQAQLKATKSRTRDLIEQTNAIQDQAADVDKRTKMIERFMDKYQLTERQEQLLRSSGGNESSSSSSQHQNNAIGEEFFEALEQAQIVHANCKALFQNNRLAKQTTALEVMDQMAHLQESGLQRLFRWTQTAVRSSSGNPHFSEFNNKDSKAAAAGNDNLAKAMEQLSKRPPLFNSVIEDYCTARRSMLVRAFLDALTVGGPHGTPRPIELHAHDPLRYVGDMLAWLHQTTPTESDSLKSILKLVNRVGNATDDVIRSHDVIVEDALCDVTDGVCRPLRSRIEQILVSEATAVMLYKLANLIRFYSSTIVSVVPAKSELIKTLQDLDEMAYKHFISVLQATVHQQTTSMASTGNGLDLATSDLAPSQSTLALLALLRETLSSSSVMEEQQSQLEEMVSVVVNPLVEAVGEAASTLPTTDQDVYILNSFYQIHTTLSLFKFNDARLSSLEREMQLHLDTLSSELTSSLIAKLDFQPLCSLISQNQGQGQGKPLSKVQGMEPESLAKFMAKFDGFLVAPEVYFVPQIRLLVSSNHRKIVSKRSLQVVSASYKQLYDAIMNPDNQYPNPSNNIVTKTPEQIDLLLQL